MTPSQRRTIHRLKCKHGGLSGTCYKNADMFGFGRVKCDGSCRRMKIYDTKNKGK